WTQFRRPRRGRGKDGRRRARGRRRSGLRWLRGGAGGARSILGILGARGALGALGARGGGGARRRWRSRGGACGGRRWWLCRSGVLCGHGERGSRSLGDGSGERAGILLRRQRVSGYRDAREDEDGPTQLAHSAASRGRWTPVEGRAGGVGPSRGVRVEHANTGACDRPRLKPAGAMFSAAVLALGLPCAAPRKRHAGGLHIAPARPRRLVARTGIIPVRSAARSFL